MNDDTKTGSNGGPGDDYRGESAGPDGGYSVAEFEGVVEATVTAVSALTGVDPSELKPLHDVVDVDALKNLFAPRVDGTPRTGGVVSFTYCGCRVIVEGTDQVTVEQGTEAIERRP